MTTTAPISLSATDRVFILTGAGISAESGFDPSRLSGDEMTEALVRLVLEDERV